MIYYLLRNISYYQYLLYIYLSQATLVRPHHHRCLCCCLRLGLRLPPHYPSASAPPLPAQLTHCYCPPPVHAGIDAAVPTSRGHLVITTCAFGFAALWLLLRCGSCSCWLRLHCLCISALLVAPAAGCWWLLLLVVAATAGCDTHDLLRCQPLHVDLHAQFI